MTMGPDGSHLKLLTRRFDPSISPNGREVVVQRFEKLAVVGAGGGHERVFLATVSPVIPPRDLNIESGMSS